MLDHLYQYTASGHPAVFHLRSALIGAIFGVGVTLLVHCFNEIRKLNKKSSRLWGDR